jgi:hypothetical protein
MSWLMRWRRLVRDVETLPAMHEAMEAVRSLAPWRWLVPSVLGLLEAREKKVREEAWQRGGGQGTSPAAPWTSLRSYGGRRNSLRLGESCAARSGKEQIASPSAARRSGLGTPLS